MAEPKGYILVPVGFNPSGDLRSLELTVDDFLRVNVEGGTLTVAKHNILDGDTHGDSVAAAVVRGGILVGSSAPAWSRLDLGADNAILASDGTDLAYETLASILKAAILTSNGDILIRDNSGNVVRLAKGSNADVLTLAGGAASWAAPAAAGEFSLIEDIELTGDATTIDFQNIAADYKHLKIIASLRSDRGSTGDELGVRFNNDSGNNYWGVDFRVTHSNTLATLQHLAQSEAIAGKFPGGSATALLFSTLELNIADYLDATKLAVITSFGNFMTALSSGNLHYTGGSGIWNDASAITRITLLPIYGTNFVEHSKASLYGLG